MSRIMMNSHAVRALVESEIAGLWAITNLHDVDLRKSLMTPERITVVDKGFGENGDELLEVWLVLEELPNAGYRIVFDENRKEFGLACGDLSTNSHLSVICWYDDFMNCFTAM